MPEPWILHSSVSEWHADCFAASASDIYYAFIAFVNRPTCNISYPFRFSFRLRFSISIGYGFEFSPGASAIFHGHLPDI